MRRRTRSQKIEGRPPLARPVVLVSTISSVSSLVATRFPKRRAVLYFVLFYRPQTKFAKVMFLQVSVILSTGGACVVAPRGGVCGCSGGACIVAWGSLRGCSGGACVVALGGCAWLLWGGMCGYSGGHALLLPGGACVVAPGGGMHGFFDEIRSMRGRYASYWNAYLFGKKFHRIERIFKF